MAVHFKFKSGREFDSLSIDGNFISVGNLKKIISERKKLESGTEYDLIITNAESNEEYADEEFLVPKNTSVVVRRVPGRRNRPIVAESKSSVEVPSVVSGMQNLEFASKSTVQSFDDYDEFGSDLYELPEVVQAPVSSVTARPQASLYASTTEVTTQGYRNEAHGKGRPAGLLQRGHKNPPQGYVCHRCGIAGHYIQECPIQNHYRSNMFDDFGGDADTKSEVSRVANSSFTEEEDEKIKAFLDTSASEWRKQTSAEPVAAVKNRGNQGQRRGAATAELENKNPHPGYVCHRCGVQGHYIQFCPTNGDPDYDKKKIKPPTGIPKAKLMAHPDGSYFLPTGEVAVLKADEGLFEQEVEYMLPSASRQASDVPPELCCPICKNVIKDAVLTSRCCFKSFCDGCVRNQILSEHKCVCGATKILADDLLPNLTLREALNRFLLESQSTVTSSGGNFGSQAHVSDMQSGQHTRPNVKRPTVSVSLNADSSAVVKSNGRASVIEAATEPEVLDSGKKDIEGATEPAVLDGGKKDMEEDDCVESQPSQSRASEPGTETSKRPAKLDSELKEQRRTAVVKGKKKLKNKRAREVDMAHSQEFWNNRAREEDMAHSEEYWNNGPHYNNVYEQPWNMYNPQMMGGMQRPPHYNNPYEQPWNMYNPQMMGGMQQPPHDNNSYEQPWNMYNPQKRRVPRF